MKTIITILKAALASMMLIAATPAFSQGVIISQNPSDVVNPASMLEVKSDDKGLLIPRMTEAQRLALTLSAPAQSLLVFQTDGIFGYYYNTSTTTTPSWVRIYNGTTDAWKLAGNDLTAANAATSFVGTKNAFDLILKTNSTEQMRITSGGNVGIGTILPPASKLEVNGNIRLSGSTVRQIEFTNPNLNTQFVFQVSNGALGMGNGGEGNSMFVANGGNVGIGTLAPQRKLHVNINNNAATTVLALENTNTTNNNGVVVSFRTTTTGTGGTSFVESAAISALFSNHNHSTISSALSFHVAGNGILTEAGRIAPTNTFLGFQSGNAPNSQGSNNVAVGNQALMNNTTAGQNVAIGTEALKNQSFPGTNNAPYNSNNVAIGFQALVSNQPSSVECILSGEGCLGSSLCDLTGCVGGFLGGVNNVAIGNKALSNNISGIANTAVGSGANVTASNLFNATAIGANATVSVSNSLVLGDSKVNIGIGTSAPAVKLDVRGSIRAIGTGQGTNFPTLFVAGSGNSSATTPSLIVENAVGVTLFKVLDNGKIGIGNFGGITTPARQLHILAPGGSIGATPNTNATVVIEKNGTSYLNLLTPSTSENGITMGMGTPSNAANSAIIFNAQPAGSNPGTPNGLQIRTGGNITRMTIDAFGNVGIATFSPDRKFSVNGNASKVGGGLWESFSDRRMKKDINEFTDGLEIINQINPVQFQYNGLAGYPDDGKQYVGIIAQDMQKIAPYMIEVKKKKLNESDKEETDLLMYDPSALVYILVNAIKEQQQTIEELKKESKTAKVSMDAVESKLQSLDTKLTSVVNTIITAEK